MPEFDEERYKKSTRYYSDAYKAAEDVDGIVVLTEWDEFSVIDYGRVYNKMRNPAYIFDGRNILDHKSLMGIGFKLYALGRDTRE